MNELALRALWFDLLALSHTGSHIYVYLQINLRLPLPYQNGNHMMYDSFLFQILQLDSYYSMQQQEFLSSSKLLPVSANTFLQASKHLYSQKEYLLCD